ncbi:hypothetical protein BDN72DRAFT_776151 [Pluteus cervinus]|uniref:Uncharacterized protein n=1 Tax=Pluteus cervinus TaxID=181527 RepID=A0ACD3ACR3_9AGAR|nr:hypothetical protein BDN72DRAFT_776151 [Pluteus cervinus]
MAGVAALNSGITAATFFGIREYAVSPVLVSSISSEQYIRRRQFLGISQPDDSLHTLSEAPSILTLRTQKLLDTSLSGALAGGLIRGWKSGPRAIIPGAIMAASVCSLLQLAYNELGLRRLQYLMHPPQPVVEVPLPQPEVVPTQKSISDRIASLLGMQTVSDEQYLMRLKKTRDMHLKRIEELEAQISEENKEKT